MWAYPKTVDRKQMETLRYVVLANGLLLVVSVAYYVLLRRETFFGANRLALWLGVVAALGLPLLTLPDWRPQPIKSAMQRTARVIVPRVLPAPPPADVTITMPNGQTYKAFGGRLPAPVGWSWQRVLLTLYGVVTLVLLSRLLIQLVSLSRLIGRSAHERYDDFVLVHSSGITSPFSFFGWVALNPDHHTSDELEQILRHERVHVCAWHSVDMLGAEVLSIIFWFNPAVYLFRHLLHQTLEFAADRAVLNEGVDPRTYQYNLVKVSLAGGGRVIGNTFSGSGLKQRIGMMNRQRSDWQAWFRYVTGFAMVLITAIGCHWSASVQHQYVSGKGDKLYALITPKTTSADLDTLRKVLAARDVLFSIDSLVRLPNSDISRISLSVQVPRPGHPITTTIGSLAGTSVIPSIGVSLIGKDCRVGAISESFPTRLQTLARREGTPLKTSTSAKADNTERVSGANSVFGLYRLFYRNDFLESSYFGLHSTGIRLTPAYHLDLYPEYENAVVLLDGNEINRRELNELPAIDLKKVVVFRGQAAVHRLGDERARPGLLLLYRYQNSEIGDKLVASPLLEEVYPTLFSRQIGDVYVHQ